MFYLHMPLKDISSQLPFVARVKKFLTIPCGQRFTWRATGKPCLARIGPVQMLCAVVRRRRRTKMLTKKRRPRSYRSTYLIKTTFRAPHFFQQWHIFPFTLVLRGARKIFKNVLKATFRAPHFFQQWHIFPFTLVLRGARKIFKNVLKATFRAPHFFQQWHIFPFTLVLRGARKIFKNVL